MAKVKAKVKVKPKEKFKAIAKPKPKAITKAKPIAQTKGKVKQKSRPREKLTLDSKKSRNAASRYQQQQFKKCPKCTKENGFYVYLLPRNGSKSFGNYGVRLVCTKCRQVFQIGLIMESAE